MLRQYAHQSGRPPITLNLWVHALDGKAERGGDRAHAGLSEHLYQRRPSRLKARILDNHRVSLCQHGGPYKPELNIAGDGNLNFCRIVVGKLGDQILRWDRLRRGNDECRHQMHFTDMMGFARALHPTHCTACGTRVEFALAIVR